MTRRAPTALVSGDRSLAVGSVTTNQQYCHINLTMRGGIVVAANYRSQGKLLSPSLPCYSVLHTCVPDPSAVAARRQNVGGSTREANEFCKALYTDPRLDPLRQAMSFDAPPTLSMQSNTDTVTEEQRAALDTYAMLLQKCRGRVAEANPQFWKILVQVNPNPSEELKRLYDREITFGQYNSYRQEIFDKVQAAVANQSR